MIRSLSLVLLVACHSSASDDQPGERLEADDTAPSCTEVEDCAAPGDEDCDGLIDCEDADCFESPTCVELDCEDSVDNDDDGLADCEDDDCWGPVCTDWASVVRGGTFSAEVVGTSWVRDWRSEWSRSAAGWMGSVEGELALWSGDASEWVRCDWRVEAGSFASSSHVYEAYGEIEVSSWYADPVQREGFTVDAPCRATAAQVLPSQVAWDGWVRGRPGILDPVGLGTAAWYQGTQTFFRSTDWGVDERTLVSRQLFGGDPIGRCTSGEPTTHYPDEDGDGYGDRAGPVPGCGELPDGLVAEGTDCDDADPTVHPEAEEVCADGIDQDCDGYLACTTGPTFRITKQRTNKHLGEALGIADLDGDGQDDLVVGSPWEDGDGDGDVEGGFYAVLGPLTEALSMDQADRVWLPTSGEGHGSRLAVGDLDGDGIADILGSQHGSFTGYLLRGPVLEGGEVEEAWGPTIFPGRVVPDVNGDGIDDLLRDGGDAAAVWFGGESLHVDSLSGAVFQDPHSYQSRYAATVVDLNGDGAPDVAVGNPQQGMESEGIGNAVGIFFGPPGAGTTEFVDADVLIVDESRGNGFGSRLVGQPDGDGDGYAELWVGNRGVNTGGGYYPATYRSGHVRLFEGPFDESGAILSPDAATAEVATTHGGIPFQVQHLESGDFDGDSVEDLVLVDGKTAWILRGPFSGTRDAQDAEWGVTPDHDVGSQWVLAVGDLDGDGLDDMAYATPDRGYGVHLILGATLLGM